MDTNPQSPSASPRPDRYRKHSIDFKRTLAELSLQPGASVARIALEHGVNTNQVFSWRKLYNEGRLEADAVLGSAALLPVTLTNLSERSSHSGSGSLLLEVGQARLHIEGTPDAAALAQVLDRLLR